MESKIKQFKWFQISVIASFVIFCGVMLFVVVVVVQRKSSGSMGIDASRIQQMRHDAVLRKVNDPISDTTSDLSSR